MKADAIPEGWEGLWFVMKQHIPQDTTGNRFGKQVFVPAGTMTYLRCITDSTIFAQPPGDLVMEDSNYELQTHLGFVMRAFGSVLITGLGLGCVVRGLLANPKVEHVTVIENSPDVLKLVAPHMPTERLTIIEAEALKWTATNKQPFDCGWHDLWTNRDAGEPHLDMWHTALLMNCRRTIKQQGAWALNRTIKREMVKHGFPWIG